jgi:hypothetical protein
MSLTNSFGILTCTCVVAKVVNVTVYNDIRLLGGPMRRKHARKAGVYPPHALSMNSGGFGGSGGTGGRPLRFLGFHFEGLNQTSYFVRISQNIRFEGSSQQS